MSVMLLSPEQIRSEDPPRVRGRGNEVRAGAERVIPAPAGLVYRLIADFREHHPHFLPPAFSDFGSRRAVSARGRSRAST